jgi:hypothetical protein
MATVYTQVGEEYVVDLIDGTGAVHLDASNSYVAWGTGTGTAVKGSTTLFTEASEARVLCAISQPSADINRWIGTITADGTKTITNAGLFTASTGGTLVIHGDFTGIGVVLNDQIEFTITLEQT